MNPPSPARSAATAWQPFTIGGVAAFATSPVWRLWLAAGLTALVLGASAAAFVRTAWWPVLEAAVRAMPGRGEIRLGGLTWNGAPALTLAENGFLAVVLNPTEAPVSPQVADAWVELRRDGMDVHGLFGFTRIAYDLRWEFALDQSTLEPVLAAWRPHATVGVAVAVALAQLAIWSVLALALALPLRAYAGLLRREVTLAGCWRLGVAAFLAGTLVIAVALQFYARRSFAVPDFLLAFAMAHVLDLLLLAGAPWRLPRRQARSPFVDASPTTTDGSQAEAGDAAGRSATSGTLETTPSPSLTGRSPFNPGNAGRGSTNPFAGGETTAASEPDRDDFEAPKSQRPGEEPINPS